MEIAQKRYKYNQPPARKPKKKRFLAWFLTLLFMLSIFTYVFLALNKESPKVEAGQGYDLSSQTQEVSITWPASGWSAIGDKEEGVLAVSSEQESPKPIASMTKVITALVVLDKEPMNTNEQGESYTMSSEDIAIYNAYISKSGSVMPVSEGQVISQYQMLEALLMPSANNIADSLVIKTFGSLQAYTEYANYFLKSYNLNQTTVSDASGFSPKSVSTPSDMVLIGQKALSNPIISEIVAKKKAIIPGSGEITNTNQLLNDENVIGIKTGNTDEAGNCLLFAVKYGPNLSKTFIGVVMGQPNWPSTYRSARTLRDSSLVNFASIEVIPSNTIVSKTQTKWGQSSDILTKDSLTIYGWKGKQYKANVSINNIESPALKGSTVGSAKVDGMDASTDLILGSDIMAPTIFWRLLNYW